MPHNRFFIDSPLNLHSEALLTGDEAHHLKDVMRCQIGDLVELVNGKGELASATVSSYTKKEVVLQIESVEKMKEPPARLIMALPMLRPGHMDWAIEKAVELGIDRLILYPAAQSEKKELYDTVLRRLEKIVLSATKQSGRLFTPELKTAKSLAHILNDFSGEIIWAEKSENSMPILKKLEMIPKNTPLLLLSGPEKGWSEKEKNILFERSAPVLLSNNILRAETAALILVAFASIGD